eukprot:4083818-Alexandrium_andersonii.AAC.1
MLGRAAQEPSLAGSVGRTPAAPKGRVPRSWEPPVVHDRQAGVRLWEVSEEKPAAVHRPRRLRA